MANVKFKKGAEVVYNGKKAIVGICSRRFIKNKFINLYKLYDLDNKPIPGDLVNEQDIQLSKVILNKDEQDYQTLVTRYEKLTGQAVPLCFKDNVEKLTKEIIFLEKQKGITQDNSLEAQEKEAELLQVRQDFENIFDKKAPEEATLKSLRFLITNELESRKEKKALKEESEDVKEESDRNTPKKAKVSREARKERKNK